MFVKFVHKYLIFLTFPNYLLATLPVCCRFWFHVMLIYFVLCLFTPEQNCFANL